MRKFVLIIMFMLSFGLIAQEVKQDSTGNKQKIGIKARTKRSVKKEEFTENEEKKIPKEFYQKSVNHNKKQRTNPPRKKPLSVRKYPEKSSGELVEFGWLQFKDENYEHAAECFQELVTRKDSLANAYLGLGWSKLMLYRPIEETRIIKSSDYVKNREFYILKPDEFLDLYSEEDKCPTGWVNNAIKLNENGEPQHIFLKENMPMYDWDWFPICLYVNGGSVINEQYYIVRGTEIDSDNGTIYNFLPMHLSKNNNEYCSYNHNWAIITIYDEFNKQFNVNLSNCILGTGYLRIIEDTLYWTDGIELSDKAGNTPNLLFDLSRSDSTNVKIIKRTNQNHNTDTWDYQVFNLYDFDDEKDWRGVRKHVLNEEAFTIDIYKMEDDGTKSHIITGTDMTYLEFLRLDTNNDGKINNLDSSINLEENWFRFPFIRPFDSLGENKIYDSNFVDKTDTNIFIELKLRYIDYDAFLKISRIFADATKYIDREENDLYLSGESFRWLIMNRYKASIECSSKLIDQNWILEQNSEINFRDLIILRSFSFFKQEKLSESLLEIQKIEPEFNPDITNQKGIKELHSKIEKFIKTLEIVIK